MNVDPKWIPMKWPGGRLEIAWRAKIQTLTAELKGILTAWNDPSTLELVKGTAVNCLIVLWAAGLPEDLMQQQALIPLVEAGRIIGVSQRAPVAAGMELHLPSISTYSASEFENWRTP